MEKETLNYILSENTRRPLPQAAPRCVQLPLDSGKVITNLGYSPAQARR